MNGRDGFRGFGHGFGRPSPMLKRVFQMSEAPMAAHGPLGQQFEPIVKKYRTMIVKLGEKWAQKGRLGLDAANAVDDLLRSFAREIEVAEGEDPGTLNK